MSLLAIALALVLPTEMFLPYPKTFRKTMSNPNKNALSGVDPTTFGLREVVCWSHDPKVGSIPTQVNSQDAIRRLVICSFTKVNSQGDILRLFICSLVNQVNHRLIPCYIVPLVHITTCDHQLVSIRLC